MDAVKMLHEIKPSSAQFRERRRRSQILEGGKHEQMVTWCLDRLQDHEALKGQLHTPSWL